MKQNRAPSLLVLVVWKEVLQHLFALKLSPFPLSYIKCWCVAKLKQRINPCSFLIICPWTSSYRHGVCFDTATELKMEFVVPMVFKGEVCLINWYFINVLQMNIRASTGSMCWIASNYFGLKKLCFHGVVILKNHAAVKLCGLMPLNQQNCFRLTILSAGAIFFNSI